jgi:peptidoglycan hydrolase CwlO-like protein
MKMSNIKLALKNLKISKKFSIIITIFFTIALAGLAFLASIYKGYAVVIPESYTSKSNEIQETGIEIQALEVEVKNAQETVAQKEIEKIVVQDKTSKEQTINTLNEEVNSLNSQIEAKRWEIYDARVQGDTYSGVKSIIERGPEAVALYYPNYKKYFDSDIDYYINYWNNIHTQKQEEYDNLITQKTTKESERDSLNNEINAIPQKVAEIETEIQMQNVLIESLDSQILDLKSKIETDKTELQNLKHWTQILQERLFNIRKSF